MPNAKLERNTFVKGLITEASPLTYPENASIEEDNFILNREGSRQRRLGMDYESLNVLLDTHMNLTTYAGLTISTFKWENVGNDITKTFGVIQIANKLIFVDANKSVLSANVVGTLGAIESTPLQYTSINGNLIIVGENISYPVLIKYDAGAGIFSADTIFLKVRDIWGVDDGLKVDEIQTTLSILHEYNLFNQGWSQKTIRRSGTGFISYPHVLLHTDVNWPTNADIWSTGINSAGEFNPGKIKTADVGSAQAPRGRNIVDAFNRGPDRQQFMTDAGAAVQSTDPISTIPTDNESGKFTTIAAFAGRVFYAGANGTVTGGDDNSPSYSGTILFSQLGESVDKLSKCYSINDPTSVDFNIPLATDGGSISIPEASRILKLIASETSLIVLAENGVWEITGPDGIFKADDFSVSQITNIGTVSAGSVVNVEGSIFYWSKAGIYALGRSQQSAGRLIATNLSETTIQTFYISIPSVGRANAVGRYDSDSRKLSWLYNDTDTYDGVSEVNKYNRELVFDTVLQAFYTNTIGSVATDSSYVAGYIPTGAFNIINDIQNVEVNGDQVQVNGDDVTITTDVRSSGASSTKYVAIKPNSGVAETVEYTFSLYRDKDFVDWKSDDTVGVDAPAHLITGYELFADTMRKKYLPYLVMHFKPTESGFELNGLDLQALTPSSCLVRARWDFADNAVSGKFGTQFQAYRLNRLYIPTVPTTTFTYGQDTVTTKNRLRGSGRAFSMRVDTEAGKDLYLYGWGMFVEGGTDV